jgi:hypothetical protein
MATRSAAPRTKPAASTATSRPGRAESLSGGRRGWAATRSLYQNPVALTRGGPAVRVLANTRP